jgi:hypothetical protein
LRNSDRSCQPQKDAGSGEPLPIERALDYSRQVAEALAADAIIVLLVYHGIRRVV